MLSRIDSPGNRMTRSRIRSIGAACVQAWRQALALTVRERDHLIAEITQVRGLMPLLMKPRNGENWSPADKAELRLHFRRLRTISPYLVLSIVPGSFFALPILAWWLDRRRNHSAETSRLAEPDLALAGGLDPRKRRQTEQVRQPVDVSIEKRTLKSRCA